MEVQQLAREFLADCERRTKLPADNDDRPSRKTVREYRGPLEGVLLTYCARKGITDTSDLTAEELERLRDDLMANGRKSGKPPSTPTVNSYLRGINACLSLG